MNRGKSFPKLYSPLVRLMLDIFSIETDMEGSIVRSVVTAATSW
jgi:hypothetical protein